jgi:hypothetical protein
MSRNISISSGSDFTKKIFGSISKLTKPTFVHDGKIFSDTNFKNQRTIPLIEDSLYYIGHGLPDDFSLFGSTVTFGTDIEIQQMFESIFSVLADSPSNSIETRATLAAIQSLNSATNGASFSGQSLLDPYGGNGNNDQCPPP